MKICDNFCKISQKIFSKIYSEDDNLKILKIKKLNQTLKNFVFKEFEKVKKSFFGEITFIRNV